MTEEKLLPCRACGAECRVEQFGPYAFEGPPAMLWLCSKHHIFGGPCHSRTAHTTLEAWQGRESHA